MICQKSTIKEKSHHFYIALNQLQASSQEAYAEKWAFIKVLP
jgi:hypothetical protein